MATGERARHLAAFGRMSLRAAATVLAIGCALGVASWAVCPLVSPYQEPFDTGAGLLLGQSIMVVGVAIIGWRLGMMAASLATLGCYAGQLGYIWMLGGESRAWFALALFTVVPLCFPPLLAGVVAAMAGKRLKKRTTD